MLRWILSLADGAKAQEPRGVYLIGFVPFLYRDRFLRSRPCGRRLGGGGKVITCEVNAARDPNGRAIS